MSKQDLLASIDAAKEKHTHFLQTFLQAQSPNPPGTTVTAARAVTNFLSHHSIASSIIAPKEDAPNVVSILETSNPSSGPRLVMNGDLDVFPVSDSTHWIHDPWGGEIDDGRIFGRGVVDMKADTAALVVVYTHLHRFRAHLHGTCVLETVSDEETGGKWGTKYLLHDDEQKEIWRGDVVLNAEPSGLQSIRFGEKGMLRVTFTVSTPGRHGAFTHLDEGAIRTASRLIQMLVAEIEGFTEFELDPEIAEQLKKPQVRATIDEIMGTGAAENMDRPTVNIGTISGGSKVNTIPNECVFEADIRLPIGLSLETVLGLIFTILEDFPQATFAVQQAASNPPNAGSPNHPIVTALVDNAERVLGRRPVGIPSMGGTDVKHFRYLGVPGYNYGVSPGGMAGRDESVAMEDYHALIKVLAGAAWDYLGGQA
ncbi:acetylornithine deacetylase/succinyldiaminopimelate desuccinylase-like deacylase [Delphinella strobiligena]|nr:acetylornithine deacetylase/succinyldiaminopimelate desuccinylase-like deacylase [Delphinella strobiligena]